MIQVTPNKPLILYKHNSRNKIRRKKKKTKGSIYNILSVRAGNLLKKLTGAGGNLPLNLGCLIK